MGSWLRAGYDLVAGTGDHLAGDVDESIGRQFDDRPGGGFADLAPEGHDPEADGAGNRFLFGPTRDVYDTIVDYDGRLNGSEDSADVLGPSIDEATDPFIYQPGEDVGALEGTLRSLFASPGRILVLVVIVGGLWLVRPLLELASEVSDT
ncbi:hypothetical protein [Halomarina oriensis]|uniref:Uncharacterized protein n=1 Tax=Halomarina oriensis TaxID=671145 RepID=A0A6B0GHF4_9EURY|nr:hypothetical protein [Halomarina oriensis]MWG34154.1 hypothetical protein [Halomarina oriensis]